MKRLIPIIGDSYLSDPMDLIDYVHVEEYIRSFGYACVDRCLGIGFAILFAFGGRCGSGICGT